MPDERVAGLLESSETSPRADLSEPKCQRAPRYEWLNVLKQHGGVWSHWKAPIRHMPSKTQRSPAAQHRCRRSN
jgi:hypothetical protein